MYWLFRGHLLQIVIQSEPELLVQVRKFDVQQFLFSNLFKEVMMSISKSAGYYNYLKLVFKYQC